MVTTNVWYCPKHALHLMKAEYYLEHTIYCLCLYVSEENGCSSSKMPKYRVFLYLATPPTLVAMVTRKMNHFEHFYFFKDNTLHQ